MSDRPQKKKVTPRQAPSATNLTSGSQGSKRADETMSRPFGGTGSDSPAQPGGNYVNENNNIGNPRGNPPGSVESSSQVSALVTPAQIVDELAEEAAKRTPGLFKFRKGQQNFIKGVLKWRLTALLARRQYGKTTLAAMISLLKMMKTPGHTVIFASIKLDLGREIVRKEAEALQKSIAHMAQQAKAASKMLDVLDNQKARSVMTLNADDFAELYEAQRLEMRVYFSNTIYSRTKVVALTPAAVGETGDSILDEVGRAKNFREVWEAMKPIMSSNPDYRTIFTTTPPPDDGHYSVELLAPPVGMEFPVNPEGNWYKSELGVRVLRVDAWDAYADGLPIYDDDTGAPISPEQSRNGDFDKEAWDRNYGVKFIQGGTSALGLLQLDSAQRRGLGKCDCFVVQEDIDFDRGIAFLAEKLKEYHSDPIAIGGDLATTEKESSNPTAFTVMARRGMEKIAIATFVWKTREPKLAKERIRRIVETVNARQQPDGTPGGRARRMAVDATNERYFATELQQEFAALVPVELVIQSETVEQPGKEPITRKAQLGAMLVDEFDNNRITIAPSRYLKTDMRLVKRDRGTFVSDIGTNGEHGDTFDSHKLANHALDSSGGAITTVEGVRIGSRKEQFSGFKPRRLARRNA